MYLQTLIKSRIHKNKKQSYNTFKIHILNMEVVVMCDGVSANRKSIFFTFTPLNLHMLPSFTDLC